MNSSHWHLLLNHLPIIGSIIGTLILCSGFILKNNTTVKKTALGVLVFAALCAIPAYLTGEGAEEVVEKMAGVTDQVIGSHEDMGNLFLVFACVLGGISLLTFFSDWFNSKFTSSLYILVLIVAIGTCILAKQVGTSGGEIRHTEIRSNFSQQGNNGIEQNIGIIRDED